MNTCCCKEICQGCNVANIKRELEGRLEPKCPFCRKDLPAEEEAIELLMKRVEVNDPVAMSQIGKEKYDEGDYKAAFDYWTRAAALGDVRAHYELSCLYHNGQGVEKDEKKYVHHTGEAAIGGHPNARHNLGSFEGMKGRADRAVKHYIIAAKLGHDGSLDGLKILYKDGHVSKEDFTAALRGHKVAVDSTKSPQREEAVKFAEWCAERG